MINHDWFSYWDNLWHNATLDNGWPWLTIVNFHIETMFVTMRHWTMVDHGWPWLSQCDIGPRENLCHNATMVDHGLFSYWDNLWNNVTLEHSWPWMIFILRQSLSQCDIGWFSYWGNLCHVFVTMWRWAMVDHDYIPNGFILNHKSIL